MGDSHDRDRGSRDKAHRLSCAACEVDGQWAARHPLGLQRAQHAIAGNEDLRLQYEANPQEFMQRFGVAPAPQYGLSIPNPANFLERGLSSISKSTAPEEPGIERRNDPAYTSDE